MSIPVSDPATPRPHPPRNSYLDVLRGGSILGVACIHFGGSFATPDNAWTDSFHLGLFVNQFFSFAVPLFLFVSGLLAGTRAERGPVSLASFYYRRFGRIGVPYLIASAAAFFVLGHHAAWSALPGAGERFWWLVRRLVYEGVEPTFYFIPLILQLYLLQPFLKALPGWLHRIAARGPLARLTLPQLTLGLAGLFLCLHVVLGVLCYRNVLNYYLWARPCALFWLFYFFAGLHFPILTRAATRAGLIRFAMATFTVALLALAWDLQLLNDRALVGERFEHSGVDYAYVRPVFLVYDLVVVAGLAAGVALGWSWRNRVLELFGRRSLEIYLWHILVLYEIAWRHVGVLGWCRQLPELILLLCFGACLGIAGFWNVSAAAVAALRQYRLQLVRNPW